MPCYAKLCISYNFTIKNTYFSDSPAGAVFYCNNLGAPPNDIVSTYDTFENNLFINDSIYSGETIGSTATNCKFLYGAGITTTGISQTNCFYNYKGIAPLCATPTVNVTAGTYSSAQTVSLSCATPGAEIRYTLDGSKPTSTSALYSGPITINNSIALNAKAFKSGMTESSTGVYIYRIDSNAPISLKKPATDSSHHSANETAVYAVDDKLATHWCTTNLAPQWMTIDIGSQQNIRRWIVKNAETMGEPASYNTRDYKLQVSSDGINFTDVDTVIGNTAALTDRNITATSARYVRLYIITGNQPGCDGATRINEFEVYTNAAIPAPAPVAVAVSNSGFETPATSTFLYGPMTYGWTFGNGAGVQHNGSAWGAQNAPEGVQTCFLQAQGWIQQTVNFTTAGNYRVYFSASKRTGFGGTQTFDVYYDNIKIGTFTPSSGAFTSFMTNSFPATVGSHTIKFIGTTTGDNTDFIDSVSIAP